MQEDTQTLNAKKSSYILNHLMPTGSVGITTLLQTSISTKQVNLKRHTLKQASS